MKLPISEIKLNNDNPRYIKEEKFNQLIQSIKDFPEMLEVRPIVVNTENVVLGGNMRFRACLKAGIEEVPVTVVDWPEEKQREFIIKDNISGGDWDWDILANQWDMELLKNWGLDLLPEWENTNTDNNEKDNNVIDDDNYLVAAVIAYEDINDLDKITQIYDLERIDITNNMKNELSKLKKVYVFKK